jgi:antirestriction protein ArdC
MTNETHTYTDVYTRVTNEIVAAIEAGAGDWKMPWHSAKGSTHFPTNALTKARYQGINTLTLWVAAQRHGYSDNIWATYNQWDELGHSVKRGSKASLGVFWKQVEKRTDSDANGSPDNVQDDQRDYKWIAKAFFVFNSAQVEGYKSESQPARTDIDRIVAIDMFIESLNADIRHGGNRAFYNRIGDYIQLPPFEQFSSPASYYSTLFHEATHRTGHPTRLARDLTGRFGDAQYAAEELIAELGAAFIAADLEIGSEPKAESAAYIADWLKIMKADKRAIFTAASHAQRAAEYMHQLQFKSVVALTAPARVFAPA